MQTGQNFLFSHPEMPIALGYCTQALFTSLQNSYFQKASATGHLLVGNSLPSNGTYNSAPQVTLMA